MQGQLAPDPVGGIIAMSLWRGLRRGVQTLRQFIHQWQQVAQIFFTGVMRCVEKSGQHQQGHGCSGGVARQTFLLSDGVSNRAVQCAFQLTLIHVSLCLQKGVGKAQVVAKVIAGLPAAFGLLLQQHVQHRG